jgi:hypothetical protein
MVEVILAEKVHPRVIHQIFCVIDKNAADNFFDFPGVVQNLAQVPVNHSAIVSHHRPVKISEQDGHPEHERAGEKVAKKTNQG